MSRSSEEGPFSSCLERCPVHAAKDTAKQVGEPMTEQRQGVPLGHPPHRCSYVHNYITISIAVHFPHTTN